MNCRTFARRLDALGAGDLDAAARRALRDHAEVCVRCGDEWRRAQEVKNTMAKLRGPDLQAARLGVDHARDRLRAAFNRAGTPPVRFGSINTPVGRLFVAASEAGVCDVSLRVSNAEQFRRHLAGRAPEVTRDDKGLRPVLEELEAYLDGSLKEFTVPVDLRAVTGFTRRVLNAARAIRFGQVTTYGDLARRIGAGGAARAVGGALGRNPVPIIVPCHRVLAAGGALGGYTGGLGIKRFLLQLEGYPPCSFS